MDISKWGEENLLSIQKGKMIKTDKSCYFLNHCRPQMIEKNIFVPIGRGRDIASKDFSSRQRLFGVGMTKMIFLCETHFGDWLHFSLPPSEPI